MASVMLSRSAPEAVQKRRALATEPWRASKVKWDGRVIPEPYSTEEAFSEITPLDDPSLSGGMAILRISRKGKDQKVAFVKRSPKFMTNGAFVDAAKAVFGVNRTGTLRLKLYGPDIVLKAGNKTSVVKVSDFKETPTQVLVIDRRPEHGRTFLDLFESAAADYYSEVAGIPSNKHPKRGLFLPEDDPAFITQFLPAFLFRMVCGVTNFGADTFLMSESGVVTSADETTAFNVDNAPIEWGAASAVKKWLDDNNITPQALNVLRGYTGVVRDIRDAWLEISDLENKLHELAEMGKQRFYDTKASPSIIQYILLNLRSLAEDFDRLTSEYNISMKKANGERRKEGELPTAPPQRKQDLAPFVAPEKRKSKKYWRPEEMKYAAKTGRLVPQGPKNGRIYARKNKPAKFTDYDIRTSYWRKMVRGFQHDQALSALIKSTRRGDENAATFFTALFVASNEVAQVANHMVEMTSVDVSVGDYNLPPIILQFYNDYATMRSRFDKERSVPAERAIDSQGRIAGWRYLRNDTVLRGLIAAMVLQLCRSRKTRIVDDIAMSTLIQGVSVLKQEDLEDAYNQLRLRIESGSFTEQELLMSAGSIARYISSNIRNIGGRFPFGRLLETIYKASGEDPDVGVVKQLYEMRARHGHTHQPIASVNTDNTGIHNNLIGTMQVIHCVLLITRPRASEGVLPTAVVTLTEQERKKYTREWYKKILDFSAELPTIPPYALDVHTAAGGGLVRKGGYYERYIQEEADAISPKAEGVVNQYQKEALRVAAVSSRTLQAFVEEAEQLLDEGKKEELVELLTDVQPSEKMTDDQVVALADHVLSHVMGTEREEDVDMAEADDQDDGRIPDDEIEDGSLLYPDTPEFVDVTGVISDEEEESEDEKIDDTLEDQKEDEAEEEAQSYPAPPPRRSVRIQNKRLRINASLTIAGTGVLEGPDPNKIRIVNGFMRRETAVYNTPLLQRGWWQERPAITRSVLSKRALALTTIYGEPLVPVDEATEWTRLEIHVPGYLGENEVLMHDAPVYTQRFVRFLKLGEPKAKLILAQSTERLLSLGVLVTNSTHTEVVDSPVEHRRYLLLSEPERVKFWASYRSVRQSFGWGDDYTYVTPQLRTTLRTINVVV